MLFPRAAARVGSELAGTYKLKRVLGQGGMGVVYEAVHSWTGRRVAVKVIWRGESESHGADRALNEARLATQLRHPNVVDMLDMGEDEPGVLYLAMEYLEGKSLSALLEERGRLEPAAALELLLPILGAVATAHDAGILHRDLKPSNLFVSERREGVILPKLLDFGIAKVSGQDTLTRSGAVVGTPHYMAPEQASDGETGPATDTWALGVVLHECLRGERPFQGTSPAAILLKIVNTRAPRLHESAPWVPKALAAVVDRALERDEEKRFSNTRELARALLVAAVQDGIRVPDDPDPIGLPEWKRWRANLGSETVSTEVVVVDKAEAPPKLKTERAAGWRRRYWRPLMAGALLGATGAGAWTLVRPRELPKLAPESSSDEPRVAQAVSQAPAPPSSPPGQGLIEPKSAPKPPLTSASATRLAIAREQGRPAETSRKYARPRPSASHDPVSAAQPPPPPPAPSANTIPDLVHEW